jgi:hypothetical protein
MYVCIVLGELEYILGVCTVTQHQPTPTPQTTPYNNNTNKNNQQSPHHHLIVIMSNDKYSLYDPNDVVQAVVCDIGSYATKMGFAGEDFPKSYFRSVSGNRNNGDV